MQHTNHNKEAVKTICTTPTGANPSNPVFVVETYKNGTEWYRKYSDGVIEQGGWCNNIAADSTLTNNFVTEFTDAASVNIQLTFISTATYSGIRGGIGVSSNTTATFSVHYDTYTTNNGGYYWTARGI